MTQAEEVSAIAKELERICQQMDNFQFPKGFVGLASTFPEWNGLRCERNLWTWRLMQLIEQPAGLWPAGHP